jgi:hypothetical protein
VNFEETHALLTFAATIDNRKFDDATVISWQVVLDAVDGRDAMRAAVAHFRDDTAYLTPAHIRAGALVFAEDREREVLREQVQRRLALLDDRPTEVREITSGEDRSPEVLALIRTVTEALPKVDNHARAVARAQQERGRAEKPPARERKRHTKPMKFPPPATDDVAAMATRYLVDGYTAADVSDRLGISRKWCEKTAAKFTASTS